MRLLCGLYPPDSGSVEIDGTDLREMDLDEWHRLIAPMFQEFMRLPVSVAENVGVGAIDHIGDRPAVEHALAEGGRSAAVLRAAARRLRLAACHATGPTAPTSRAASGSAWASAGRSSRLSTAPGS